MAERRVGRTGAVTTRTAWWLTVAFVTLVVLMGGGSRPDVSAHVVLRPLAVLACAVALLMPVRRPAPGALGLLLALGALMLVQMVPLPPALWTALPGRELVAQIAPTLGQQPAWRPVTLSLDGTLNALFALAVPLATLLLVTRLDGTARDRLGVVVLALLGVSAALGVLQIIGPPGSALYLYRITIPNAAVGLFANPNHQAVALACAYPLLGWWSARPIGVGTPGFRRWLAVALGVLLVPMLIVTGSRAGVALGALGALGALLIARSPVVRPDTPSRRPLPASRVPRSWLFAGVGVAALALTALLLLQRDALSAVFAATSPEELRVRLLDRLTGLAVGVLPTGSGFGTFERLWRIDEPMASLTPAYLNHAHNDLLEFLIEGGIGAVALLIAAGVLVARGTAAAWSRSAVTSDRLRARAASVVIVLLALASLVDYPLRTPTGMMLMALTLAWLFWGRSSVDPASVNLPDERPASKALASRHAPTGR